MSLRIVDSSILEMLGRRLAQHRLNRNLTQEELAKNAGISIATLKRIEHGSNSTLLTNLINVLRALGLESGLDALLPEVPPSPIQLATIKRQVRKRAGRKRKSSVDDDEPTWTWSE